MTFEFIQQYQTLLAFTAGLLISCIVWMIRSIQSNTSDIKSDEDRLTHHEDSCEKRYQSLNSRLEGVERNLSRVAECTSRLDGKFDMLVEEVRKNGK